MQLSFLGQSYQASFPSVEVIETGITQTFLGKQYPQKQFPLARHPKPLTQLTYRGVPYSR